MRCTQCGWPLSPARNICPRCGTPANANTSKPAKGEVTLPSTQPFVPGPSPAPTEATNMYVPPATNWNEADNLQNPGSLNAAPTAQIPFSAQQPFQAPFSSTEGWQNGTSPEFSQQANQLPAPTVSYSSNNSYPGFRQTFTNNPYPPTSNRAKTTRMGFTVAGLCIMAGSLLLVFVYLIEQGFLLGGNASTTATNIQQSTATTSVKQTPIPTTPAIAPTPTFPGQGALNTSVLASDFNTQTGQIIPQPTDDFKVNQKIYVVLSLHPGGTSHAVCLNWYLNGESVNTYSFAVDPASNYKYYSYAMMQTTGSGYITISLASTIACADPILAQKLPFTVSP